MKSFLSRYLKFILGSVAALVVLIVVGIIAVSNQVNVEGMKSTYTLTSFDYIVTSPSDEQVTSYSQDSAVESVLPFYNVSAKVTGTVTTTITILGVDSLQGYETGFFNENNLVSGEASASGMMLDQTAADALGVSVGDTVRFTYVNQTFSTTVSGIYLACTYDLYDEGLALMVFDDDIKSVSKALNYYQGAFIQAADETACASLLSGYIPWGRFYSTYGTKEEYVEKYIGNLPTGYTEAEYTTYLENDYETKYSEWASKTYVETTSKSEQYGLISSKIESTQAKIDSLVNIVSIAVAAALAVLMVIFVITNKGNDRRLVEDGSSFGKMFAGYSLLSALCTILVAAISFIVLWIYASGSFFASACTSIIMMFSLPVLVALPVAIVAALVYLKILFK